MGSDRRERASIELLSAVLADAGNVKYIQQADDMMLPRWERIRLAMLKAHGAYGDVSEVSILRADPGIPDQDIFSLAGVTDTGAISALHLLDQVSLAERAQEQAQALLTAATSGDPHDLDLKLQELSDFTQSRKSVSLRARLADARFDPTATPPDDPVLYQFGGTEVSHPGNLGVITAQSGAGKTAVMVGGIAAALNPRECLGWQSPKQDGAVVHIDTEQSLADAHIRVGLRALSRAGLRESSRLFSFALVGWTPSDIRSALPSIINDAKRATGGVHSIWIDGTGDLADDVNDPAESQEIVTMLHRVANEHRTFVWNILHLNPGSEKMRGHLGSYLERKAETVLRLKVEGDATHLFTAKTRRAPIPESRAIRIGWSNAEGMHVRLQSLQDAKADMERAEMEMLAESVWNGDHNASFRYGELVSRIMEAAGCGERTAKAKVVQLCRCTNVKKEPVTNQYIYPKVQRLDCTNNTNNQAGLEALQ